MVLHVLRHGVMLSHFQRSPFCLAFVLRNEGSWPPCLPSNNNSQLKLKPFLRIIETVDMFEHIIPDQLHAYSRIYKPILNLRNWQSVTFVVQ